MKRALIFLLLARPPLRDIRRRDLPALLGLGVASGLMGVMFLAAIERIPLGTCVAIEFLGPLTVAAFRSQNKQALGWPVLALLGVVLLTEPWSRSIDPAGVGFAAAAGVGWGVYILLTERVGDRFARIKGLTLAGSGLPITTGSRPNCRAKPCATNLEPTMARSLWSPARHLQPDAIRQSEGRNRTTDVESARCRRRLDPAHVTVLT